MKDLLVILLLSYIGIISAGCPSGAVYNSDNNMCYKYNKDTLSFVDAESACTSLGGHIASVHNGFVNSEIRSQANNFFSCTSHSDYWLGADTYLNSSWSWTDGTPWNYNNWAPGQPSTSACPQCLSATISDGRWYSSSCDLMKAYVCEISETAPTCVSQPTQLPSPSCPAPTPRCEDGWTLFSHTGYCYTVRHNQDFWAADSACTDINAHLTSIHSHEEDQFVLDIATTGTRTDKDGLGFTWIGLYLDNGSWKWTDGTPFDYILWRPNWPSPGDYNCALMLTDLYYTETDRTYLGKYQNFHCGDVQRAFVCKKKAIV